jgi:hypothetical protein
VAVVFNPDDLHEHERKFIRVYESTRRRRERGMKAKAADQQVQAKAAAQPNLFGLSCEPEKPEPSVPEPRSEARVDGSTKSGNGERDDGEVDVDDVVEEPAPSRVVVAKESRKVEPSAGASAPDLYMLFRGIDDRLEKMQTAISIGLGNVAFAIRESRPLNADELLIATKAAFLLVTGQELDEVLLAAVGKPKLTVPDLDALLPTPQYTAPKPPVTAKQQDVQGTGPKCPKCGSNMRLRNGKRGEFWGCLEYPQCRGTIDVVEAGGTASRAKPSDQDDVGCVDF